jgi:hypothetical protein
VVQNNKSAKNVSEEFRVDLLQKLEQADKLLSSDP